MKRTYFSIRIISIVCMLLCNIYSFADEYVDIIPKSPKPSISNALRGVRSYTFATISNGQDMAKYESLPFIDAFFIKEIKYWMSQTCPDATPGENYSVPCCANVQIAVKYNHSGYYARNGVYYWNVGAYVVELIFGNREYVYQYKLPGFSVQGNYFGDHIIYRGMRDNICRYVCRYDKSATMQLQKLMTQWRESSIKKYIDEEGDMIEGIYESTAANTNGRTSKYKLALKKNNDEALKYDYYLIYLGGANYYKDWSEGEIKAFLYSTGTAGIYKTDWLMADKTINSDYYVSIGESSFLFIQGTVQTPYLKLYPTAQNRKPRQPKAWSGSGFALNNGYVVTNYHVANGAKSILVHQDKGDGTRQAYTATLAASDATNDIAILKINDPKFKGFGQIPYKIKSGTCDVGESVWALGYPMTDIMGDEVKFTDGKISARSGIDGEISVYQISVPIQHGNSGGPLFDTKGNIVGITSSGLNREMLHTENVNYAIKSNYLRLLVENSLSTSILPQGTALQGQALTTQIKLAKKFVFFIECSAEGNSGSVGSTTKPTKPTAPTTPQKPEPTRPSITPTEAMSILHGSNTTEKQKAYDALLWWANNGDAEACGYLGICYEFGTFVNKNINTAIEWFHKGANGEDARSLHELGVFYYEGEGVAKDVQKAKGYFLRAAKKKYVASYSALGELYFAEKDPQNAIKYLEEGAAAHSESAYYLLLDYYLFDKRDSEAAYTYLEMELFDREHGTIVDAYHENGYRFEYFMGFYNEFGLAPLSKDINEAIKWYKKAANHGDKDSKERLEKLQEAINKAPSANVSSANKVSFQYPKHKRDDDLSIVLTEVTITSDATTLKFSFYNWEYEKDGWISIAKKAYLIDTKTKKKYYLKEAKGIAVSPQKTGVDYKETKYFTLVFEPIPRSCHKIDFIESPKSEWQIHDIEL